MLSPACVLDMTINLCDSVELLSINLNTIEDNSYQRLTYNESPLKREDEDKASDVGKDGEEAEEEG